MSEDLKYYVYALMDSRSDSDVIFYIGKGKGHRANAHELEAASTKKESEKFQKMERYVLSVERGLPIAVMVL